LKKLWICASVIVLLLVNTASLMMFPALNPARVVFTIPPEAGWTDARARSALLEEVDAEAAAAGTAVPRSRAETARKQTRSGAVLGVFRERGARRDM
jgi:hypothetical protein